MNDNLPTLTRWTMAPLMSLLLLVGAVKAQPGSQPSRWRADYSQIYSDDIETGNGPGVKPGLQLQGSTVVTDPSLVIAGKGSVLVTNRGGFVTDPVVLPMAGNTVYTMKFDYRILSPPTTNDVYYAWFQPVGTTDPHLSVTIPSLLRNASAKGTFSAGAQTAAASSYILKFYAGPGVSIVLDNIFIYRQDVTTQTSTPDAWTRLLNAPFPRLGKYLLGNTSWTASVGKAEGKPFAYTLEQIENKLAFFDVIAGLTLENQTWDPDSIHRIRALNPNAVILPYKPADALNNIVPRPDGVVDLEYELLQSIPKEWKAADTRGAVISVENFPDIFYMNLSDFAPIVNGQTWRTALPNFVAAKIFPSGLWDGVFFDFLNGAMDGNFPHFDDPVRFNYDWNRNGVPDETRAATNEMIRNGNVKMLKQLNASANGMQLIMGNTGPELTLAPLVNGYTFECFNLAWNNSSAAASISPARWRAGFDAYRRMQATSRPPQTNVLEACGIDPSDSNSLNVSRNYLTPVPGDFQKHRFSLGTALLGDGFYSYDLYWNISAPYWFDEYSVDSNGRAVEDRAKKGYLGHPLAAATELTTSGLVVFQDGFDGATLSSSLVANPAEAVSISRAPAEVISGAGSLVIRNADHTHVGYVAIQTNPTAVPLSPGKSYILTVDWRIVDTLDNPYGFLVTLSANGQNADVASVPGVVTGDSGTLHFPFTVPSAGNWTVGIGISGGGGAVAIDNVRLYQGGIGPWRRDFENGFVLVNPLTQSHTFSAAELAGVLHRTGVRRIQGTQAPDINNGLPLSGDLTVGPFDAVILLADRIVVATPAIRSVGMAGGAPDITPNGWIEIKGANLAPPGVSESGFPWDTAPSFESGLLPTELAGMRVTVDGKPAFVYFVSSNQLNVLVPLLDTTGPVQIVVTSGGVSSAPFVANLRSAAPSFPLIGSTKYVVATHADNSLVGPASLSAPGYAFTPARSGETIVLYAFGLGLPSAPVINGASAQSGSLPFIPRVQIGGAEAMVRFAGLIGPGLYQLNIIVPPGIPGGDNALTLIYTGQSSPSGDLVNIQ